MRAIENFDHVDATDPTVPAVECDGCGALVARFHATSVTTRHRTWDAWAEGYDLCEDCAEERRG